MLAPAVHEATRLGVGVSDGVKVQVAVQLAASAAPTKLGAVRLACQVVVLDQLARRRAEAVRFAVRVAPAVQEAWRRPASWVASISRRLQQCRRARSSWWLGQTRVYALHRRRPTGRRSSPAHSS